MNTEKEEICQWRNRVSVQKKLFFVNVVVVFVNVTKKKKNLKKIGHSHVFLII